MRHAPAPTLSRTGRRSENEDTVWLRSTTDSSGRSASVLAVADGMGGHTHGAKASEIAIRGVQDAVEDWMDSSASLDEDQLRIKCRQLFGRIDQAIEIYTDEHPDAEGMGTTLVLAVVLGDQAYVAHIGDSRAYWVSPNKTADQLTLDHSAAAEAVREGRMTEAEVAGSAFQHALTRSLDGSGDSDPDFSVHSIDEPGFLVLCSDGLSGTIEDERLAQELLRNAPLAETTEALVDAAFEQGSEDNISLVVLECGTVERKESAAVGVPPPSGTSSAGQPPADQPSSSEPDSEARSSEPPVRDASPERSTSTRSGTPQWATTLLGVLVVALLGLGGWAEYQYRLVGLRPAEPAPSGDPVAAAGEQSSPQATSSAPTDNAQGDSTSLRAGVSSEPVGERSSSVPVDSSASAAEGQPDDLSNSPLADGGSGTDETPEQGEDEFTGDSDQSEDSVDTAASPGGQEGEESSANGPSEQNGNPSHLPKKSVPAIQEGGHGDRRIPPPDGLDWQTLEIKEVEGADKVGTDMELSSGARLTVEPKGHFTYDPNGTFKAKDAGDKATDEFTYTAVSESGDQELRGTVEIPVQGENTPPRLEGTKELTVRAGQVSPITSRALTATDPDDGVEELRFTVTKSPARGEIRVGGGLSMASAASSFTQRDVEEGRVFYADTAGEAGVDTFAFAVKDEDGAGLESESFRVRIEAADTTEAESQNNTAEPGDECRIRFAAKGPGVTPKDSSTLSTSDLARKLQTGGDSVRVESIEATDGFYYYLVSEQVGTESEMEDRKEKLVTEGIVDDAKVDCFYE